MPATWEHDRSVQQRAAACLLKLRCDCELRLSRGPTAAAAPALSVGGRGPVFRAQGSALHSRAIGNHQSMRRASAVKALRQNQQ